MNFNTLGELSCDFQPLRSLIIGINFKDGSKSDSRTVSKSFRSDFTLFDGKLNSYLWLTRLFTLYYFAFLGPIMFFVGPKEKPLPIPATISEPVIKTEAEKA